MALAAWTNAALEMGLPSGRTLQRQHHHVIVGGL